MTKRRTILIADNAWENRAILKEIFKNDFDIIEVKNGQEALDILNAKKNEIALLLLDIIMPVLTGHEVLKAMMNDEELSEIPTIAISASEILDDEIKCLNMGAWDFISKPFDSRIVIQRAHNVISRNELKSIRIENARLEEKNSNNEILQYHNEHDILTGLWNMQSFCQNAQKKLSRAKSKYVIIRYDISKFKIINDLFGFNKGDQLLQYIAELSQNIFPMDALIARSHADHFLVFCKEEGLDYDVIVEKFKNGLSRFDIHFDFVLNFGIYPIDNQKQPVNLMCDRALIALHTIKGNYNSHYAFYNQALREKMMAEQEIVNDMDSALKNNEFILYFQPQFNNDRKIIGAEVLVRWMHPKKGLISPGIFIPIFEKNGFITQLDKYIWEKACIWLNKWIKRHGIEKAIPISVNISRVDIADKTLYFTLVNLMKKYAIPTNLFRLEITESAYLYNPEQLVSVITRLKKAGFLIEMDDFGSGYSSLNALKNIPIDILKLDMFFLFGEDINGKGGNILCSVVRMAKWLGLPIIAEGVETKQQAEYLKSIGCYQMQGYYYSKPIPVIDFEEMLQDSKLDLRFSTPKASSLDEGDFWSPDNLNSLVFNNYVGAAGVFEYYNKVIEAIRVNDSYFEVLGLNREAFDIYQYKVTDMISKTDLPILYDMISRIIKNNTPDECVTRWTKPISNEKDFWLKIKARLISNLDGRYVFYVLIENITNQILAEKKLDYQKEKYNLILNSINAYALDYDISTDTLLFSIFKHDQPLREITMKNYLAFLDNNDFIHASDRPMAKQILLDACKTKCKGSFECRIKLSENIYQTKEIKYFSILDEDNQVCRVIAGIA